MLLRRFVAKVIAVLSLAAAAMAQSGATVTRTFPVGLGKAETVQVAVVKLADAPPSRPAASCTGSIAFFNAAETVIGTATTFTLGTGHVASARLPFASAGASGVRALFRGVDYAATRMRNRQRHRLLTPQGRVRIIAATSQRLAKDRGSSQRGDVSSP